MKDSNRNNIRNALRNGIGAVYCLVVCLYPWHGASSGSKDLRLPVTLAPDLKIVSAEFGAFPDGKGPKERQGKTVEFVPTNRVRKVGYSYGWRIKLETPRKAVNVYEIWETRNPQPGKGEMVSVADGYIYDDWDVVMGTRPGKHTLTVCVEHVPVKTFTYFVN
jgi:hypothetical protein